MLGSGEILGGGWGLGWLLSLVAALCVVWCIYMAVVFLVVSRAVDWLRQAVRDLEHAERSLEVGHYEWACFAAHQAAEKAVKALYQKLGVDVWGHSISRMLESLPEGPPRELVEMAKELDKHYISTRDLHPEGAPLDYYTRGEAERAVRYAREVVEFCRNKVL